jgi:hypothetical protein
VGSGRCRSLLRLPPHPTLKRPDNAQARSRGVVRSGKVYSQIGRASEARPRPMPLLGIPISLRNRYGISRKSCRNTSEGKHCYASHNRGVGTAARMLTEALYYAYHDTPLFLHSSVFFANMASPLANASSSRQPSSLNRNLGSGNSWTATCNRMPYLPNRLSLIIRSCGLRLLWLQG